LSSLAMIGLIAVFLMDRSTVKQALHAEDGPLSDLHLQKYTAALSVEREPAFYGIPLCLILAILADTQGSGDQDSEFRNSTVTAASIS
jgi:hypothetical protein